MHVKGMHNTDLRCKEERTWSRCSYRPRIIPVSCHGKDTKAHVCRNTDIPCRLCTHITPITQYTNGARNTNCRDIDYGEARVLLTRLYVHLACQFKKLRCAVKSHGGRNTG